MGAIEEAKRIYIDGATRVTGLIGWPVEHSLSPAMHNAAYAALGLNWCYLPFPVPPAQVSHAVNGVRALGLAGVNVTIPHKESVIPYLDELTPAAAAIGAVNTIIVKEGRLVGDNTDVYGFLEALKGAGVTLEGSTALVLGAGGAARAAAYGLLTQGCQVWLLARTPARAQQLAADMRRAVPTGHITVLEKPPQEVDIVIHCTPVGMWPHADQSPLPAGLHLRPGMTVMDMVYRPLKTMLLQQAEAAGARIVNGLEMLIHGGAAAFQRWTGHSPPIEVMRAACLNALGEPAQ